MDQIEEYKIVLKQRDKAINAHADIIEKNKELLLKIEELENHIQQKNIIIVILLFLLVLIEIVLIL